MIGWLLIGAIFIVLAPYLWIVSRVVDFLRPLAAMVRLIAHGDDTAADIERAGDVARAAVAAVTGYADGTNGIAPRADTLTCPRCRRAWPLVTYLGRTRCPACGVVVLGWQ